MLKIFRIRSTWGSGLRNVSVLIPCRLAWRTSVESRNMSCLISLPIKLPIFPIMSFTYTFPVVSLFFLYLTTLIVLNILNVGGVKGDEQISQVIKTIVLLVKAAKGLLSLIHQTRFGPDRLTTANQRNFLSLPRKVEIVPVSLVPRCKVLCAHFCGSKMGAAGISQRYYFEMIHIF